MEINSDNIRIINDDSRKLSNFIGKEGVDFIVFSPPYWNLRDYKHKAQIGLKDSYQEYLNNMKKVFEECYKVLKSGRFMAINIGTVVSNEGMKFIAGDFVKDAETVGFTFRKDIIWNKPRGQTKWQRGATKFSQNPYPLMFNTNINHEYILIFQKGSNGHFDFSKESKFNRLFIRKMAYSVWDIPPINSPKKDESHVAPFPEELPKRLILLFSFKNEVVLDPFAGCGTTNKVAKELGRKSIAVELSKDYCKLIEKKVKETKFDSIEKEIYDHSIDYELVSISEKMEKALKDYEKFKKAKEKLEKGDKQKRGLNKFF